MSELTRRQVQIVAKIAVDKTDERIAEELGISLGMVKLQIRRAMDKTRTSTREELCKAAIRGEDRKQTGSR